MRDPYDKIVESITEDLETQISFFKDGTRGPFSKCESPIEKIMAIGLYTLGRSRLDHVTMYDSRHEPEVVGGYTLVVIPQYQVDQYRVDLLVGYQGAGEISEGFIAVECDGHAFHEKTKDQAKRDKARDRFLSTRVAKVIRFTGSEIYGDPVKCCNEVFDLAMSLLVSHDMRRLPDGD